MEFFAQQFFNALQRGSLLALIALGYTMVYGVLLLINFAHGDIFMMGAFFGVFGSMVLGLPFVPTLLLSMAITGLMGVGIERVAYKPLREASRLSVVITALGIGLVLENGMLALNGADPRRYPEAFTPSIPFLDENIAIADASISNIKILIIALAFLLFFALYTIVQRTKWGMAMRAISYDKFAVPLMGVSQDQIISLTFLLGTSLAAAGGILWVIAYTSLDTYDGMAVGWKSFTAAVVGGIGDIRGAMVGGLLLGFIEIFVPAYGKYIGVSSTWRDPVAFGLLLLILVFRPTGLFGVARRQKV
jgi:branched-chain amino acid transport system permease protein